VIQGDCLDVMRDLPEGSVDLVLTDLPYGTTRNQWDCALPLSALWAAYRRVLAPGASIVLTAQSPFDKLLACSNLSWLRHEWVWVKEQGTGHLNANRAPLKQHEVVLVFCARGPTYSPQMAPGRSYTRTASRRLSGNYGYYVERDRAKGPQRYPTTVLTFAHDHPRLHPTQKPVALFAYLMRTYSAPGALVLDNCAGSGTTAVAAIEEGRHYLLIEKEQQYARLCAQRIAAAQPRLPFTIAN
jgi:site-specific DNA-methyltransferase (adenine-specific)